MSKSILTIEKGSIITRVKRSERGDGSYMGDKLKFIGIANHRIYFQNLEPHHIAVFGEDNILGVDLELWEFGWDYYICPKTLLNSL